MEKIDKNKEAPKTSHNILDDKAITVDKETGTVTLPERNLANLQEALTYTREQEKIIVSKLRESNEYVINEVKEMLEGAFQGGYHSDKLEPEKGYSKSAVCSDHNYEWDKTYYVEGPLKFLSEYKGNLKVFMDFLAQELKDTEFGRGGSLDILCNRFGITVEDFKKMDTESIIEMVKKDIKNIPSLNPSTCANDMREHLGTGAFYLNVIRRACVKLGYKQ